MASEGGLGITRPTSESRVGDPCHDPNAVTGTSPPTYPRKNFSVRRIEATRMSISSAVL
jgi:hypothetical protein